MKVLIRSFEHKHGNGFIQCQNKANELATAIEEDGREVVSIVINNDSISEWGTLEQATIVINYRLKEDLTHD